MLMLRQSIFLQGWPGVIDVLATSTSVTKATGALNTERQIAR